MRERNRLSGAQNNDQIEEKRQNVFLFNQIKDFFSMLANVVGHFLDYRNKLEMVLKILETWLQVLRI